MRSLLARFGFTRSSKPDHARSEPCTGAGEGGSPYFSTYNSTAAQLHCSATRIGSQFVLTLICRQCVKEPRLNSADPNLAVALSMLLDSYGAHARKYHK